MHAFRFVLRPQWIALHLFTVALMVTMILLGRWQLLVSNHKHFDLQNFGYAIQWWVFSCFALLAWARLVRDRGQRERVAVGVAPAPPGPPEHEVVAYRRYIAPTAASTASEDPYLSAYNDYLSGLAADDAAFADREDVR